MRVVVVDPSRTVLKAVSRLLESAGHGVAAFVDAREAFDYIKSDREVSALLASAQLNSMSGLELCWETRLLSGRERPIYIILMSSNSDQQHLINALDSGADEFIRKPPVGEELYARLRSAERLLRLQNELIELASIDPLTHVFNRRAFFDRAQLSCRGASPLAAIMLDVDHFKRINDTYGHDVGDQVLGAIGREFQSENAVVGRLGGEEFAILIDGASGEAAVERAEFLRARVAALSFDAAGEKASVTCSLGVAERRPGESIDQLLRRADTALYEAKSSGRDRVVETGAVLDSGEGQVPRLVRAARRGTEDGDQPQAAVSQSRPLTGQPSAREEKASRMATQPVRLRAWPSSSTTSRRSAPLSQRCCRRADLRRGSSRPPHRSSLRSGIRSRNSSCSIFRSANRMRSRSSTSWKPANIRGKSCSSAAATKPRSTRSRKSAKSAA